MEMLPSFVYLLVSLCICLFIYLSVYLLLYLSEIEILSFGIYQDGTFKNVKSDLSICLLSVLLIVIVFNRCKI